MTQTINENMPTTRLHDGTGGGAKKCHRGELFWGLYAELLCLGAVRNIFGLSRWTISTQTENVTVPLVHGGELTAHSFAGGR